MNRLMMVSAIALCTGMGQVAFAQTESADTQNSTADQATSGEALENAGKALDDAGDALDEAGTALDKAGSEFDATGSTAADESVNIPVVVDESYIGKVVYSSDTGAELGTIANVQVNVSTPSEVTIALEGDTTGTAAEQMVVQENDLSLNASGQLVADISAGATAEPPTGSIGEDLDDAADSTDSELERTTPDTADPYMEEQRDENLTQLPPTSPDSTVAETDDAADLSDRPGSTANDYTTGSISDEANQAVAEPMLSKEEVVERALYNAQGEKLGEIRDVVMSGGEQHLLVGFGGFFGYFESKALIPAEDVHEDANNRLVASISREQLKELPAD